MMFQVMAGFVRVESKSYMTSQVLTNEHFGTKVGPSPEPPC